MMPTTHVAGLQVLIRSILAGFPPVVVDLSDGFRPQGLVDAAATLLNDIGPEPRYTALVPTQLQRILDAGGAAVAALMALDAVLLGGSAPSPELVGRAHDAGITLVQSYGMTETCGGCVYDGVPLDGVSVTIGVERRIEIAGAMLFSGYRGLPDLTSSTLRAGRFLTSDLGRFDEHGRLHIVGRADDVVITGGVNVSCYIVERVLASHPAIHEVAVVGVLDSEWGERLVAIAVTGETLQLEALRAFAADHLDRAALPRQLLTVDSLPHLASGKPDRQALRSLVPAVNDLRT
jgi:O-succinylbenzoic acid--CoA ligase